jgi:hypothetical protein
VGDQLGDQPLPAEEIGGVAGFEAGQALVGTDRRRRPVLRRLVRLTLTGRQPRDLFAVLAEVDHVVGQLGLDRLQVAAAAGRLAGRLLHLVGRLRLRPRARGLVHQQRHAAGGVQDQASGRPCRLLTLIHAEDLGHLILIERAESSRRDGVRTQPLDQRVQRR